MILPQAKRKCLQLQMWRTHTSTERVSTIIVFPLSGFIPFFSSGRTGNSAEPPKSGIFATEFSPGCFLGGRITEHGKFTRKFCCKCSIESQRWWSRYMILPTFLYWRNFTINYFCQLVTREACRMARRYQIFLRVQLLVWTPSRLPRLRFLRY